jgi:hypothetical protein
MRRLECSYTQTDKVHYEAVLVTKGSPAGMIRLMFPCWWTTTKRRNKRKKGEVDEIVSAATEGVLDRECHLVTWGAWLSHTWPAQGACPANGMSGPAQ